MDTKTPLFNSKVIKIYLEYIAENYPEIDINPIFKHSGITPHEINESSHWFNESQVDRFYMFLLEKIGNQNLARDVGRYIVSARVMGILKKFVMGLMDTVSIYMQIEKNYKILNKAADVKAKKLGKNKIEITTIPKPGTEEKPYMCQNRTGIFEALATIFTNKFANIEEISCVHKGGSCCRYIITWEDSDFWRWSKLGSYSLITFIPISVTLFFLLPNALWTAITIWLWLITIFLFLYSAYLEKKELLTTMKMEGNVAKDLLDEMDIRHSNAMMVQEIGLSISNILDVEKIICKVMRTMEKHLDFDCGTISLYDKAAKHFTLFESYGCNHKGEKLLKQIEFSLESPEPSAPFMHIFKDQIPLLVNDFDSWEELSNSAKETITGYLAIKSFICVPIVYEKESMGLLFGYNTSSKRNLTQSDLSLMNGVASEIAISIANAISFQKLQESEDRYRLLAEHINDVIWKSDLDMNWRYISPSFQKLTGYSQKEAMSLPIEKVLTPSSLNRFLSVLEEKLHHISQKENENMAVKVEVEYFCKDHSTIWAEIDASFLFDEEGKPNGVLGVSRNIIDRKQAEHEKNMLETKLKQKYKMEAIGTMAGGIAHDFNNILGIILGNSELATYDLPSSHPARQPLEEIKTASFRGKEVVMQLLNFARRTDHQKQAIKIVPLVKKALKSLRVIVASNIEIHSEISEFPDMVVADPIQIHQVVLNLCKNAAQAMNGEKGLLKIKLTTTFIEENSSKAFQRLSPGKYVLLTVKDTGHGIPNEIFNRIFDPYFTTKEIGQGSGMGLSIVHGIAKNIGAEIQVTSHLEEGTTFEIFFPAVTGEDINKEKTSVETSAHGKERILIIDDEKQIVNFWEQLLSKMGYKVTGSTSGKEILEKFRLHPDEYDLVITDMAMPEIAGDKLAEKILRIRGDIPIILCTGYNDNINMKKAKEIGIKAFLMKPIGKNELAKTIRDVIGNR